MSLCVIATLQVGRMKMIAAVGRSSLQLLPLSTGINIVVRFKGAHLICTYFKRIVCVILQS